MSSQLHPQSTMAATLWEFELARDFSRTFRSFDNASFVQEVTEDVQVPKATSHGLGDFDRVFEYLGRPIELRAPKDVQEEHHDSTSTVASSYSTSASSEPAASFEDLVHTSKPSKEVGWEDKAKIKNEQSQQSSKRSKVVQDLLGYIPKSGGVKSTLPSSSNINDVFDTPPSTAVPNIHLDPSVIRSFFTLTEKEQEAKLVRKIIKRYPESKALLEAPTTSGPSRNLGKIDNGTGIHIFVDFSNIVIGFYERIKLSRNIHEKANVKSPPLSFRFLALCLERGRHVARRVLVGSTARYLYSGSPQKTQTHFDEAKSCGYEVNLLERVSKSRPLSSVHKKKHGAGSGYATTSGPDSGSEFEPLRKPIMAEQAVDELLQMKLLESLIDTETPSTIVLASGDAAEAEYSGGFLKNVERALMKGWKVEVVSWHEGLSREYRNEKFMRRWEGRIRIIELDEFCEELLAIYVQGFPRLT